LFLCVALAVGLAAIGAALASRRDFGAGLIAPRAGPASGAPSLGTPLGLAVRLQRGVVWWWAVGVFLAGVAYGSIAESIEDFIADSEALEDIVARVGAATVVDAYLATTLLILALLAAGCGLQAVQRLRSEESERRAEPVLSTRTSRWRWAGSHLAVAYGGTVLVLAAGGFGAGLIYGLIIGDLGQVGRLLAAALAYTPAAWVMIAIGVALFGFAPRWTMLAWAPLSVCFVIGLLGDLLGLPRWLEDLSPFERTPSVPAVDLALGPLIVMTVVGIGVTWLGLAGFQRRDIG
jgi:ABC-2 type transport system permease protein